MAPSGTVRRLGKRDAAILAALAGGQTFEQAAASAGVSRRTVARRAAALRPELQEVRRSYLDQAATIYTAHAAEVAERIALMALAPSSLPPHVRLRALESVADRAHRTVELLDLEGRVAQLEARTKGGR